MTLEAPAMSLDALVESAYRIASAKLREQSPNDVMAQFCAATCTNGMNVLYVCPWGDDESKHAMMQVLRKLFIANDVVGYAIACEAWAAAYDDGEDESVLPSDKPNKIEVLNVYGEMGNTKCHRSWKMIRDRDGKIVALEQQDISEGDSESPIFGGLLRRVVH